MKNSNNKLGFDYGRQMFLDQRNKSLVSVCNHLKEADIGDYNQLHARYSRIYFLMEDFSKGKGNKAVYVYYNLEPRDVKTIHHWISSVYPLRTNKPHNYKLFKTLNDKYWQFEIVHNPDMKNPIGVIVTNGKADKNKKPINNTDVVVKQWYSYELFYAMWTDITDKLKMWETIHYSRLCKKGEPITAKAVFESRKNNNNEAFSNNTPKNTSNNFETTIPPLAPLPFEDEIPFSEMPAYGSAYKR